MKLEELRWWHLPQVMELEQELFGDEQWSPEMFWSELALCSALDGSGGGSGPLSRRYLAVLEPDGPAPERLLGYAGVALSGDEASIQSIGVTRDAQRAGIGGALMTGMLDTARGAGCDTCWLEVRSDNVAAQSVYRRFGFVQRGVRRGYYQPSGTDALVLSVDLRSAGS